MPASSAAAPDRRQDIIVVGAGVGGLAAAVRLLAAGHRVTVLEKEPTPGGKMRQIAVGGALFDGGPSVLTMPEVLDDLFRAAGMRRDDFVRLTPLDPLCRHFFADGSRLDLFADEPIAPGASPDAAWARSADEIGRVLGARAAEGYRRFRRHAATIYRAVERPFMRSPIPSSPLGFLWQNLATDLLGLFRIDARRTLWQALCHFFDDERLRILFARYATYSGADPFQAPATLAVIPHVELAFGVSAVEGGMYSLAEALAALVQRLGGALRTRCLVERIELDPAERRAAAVHVSGGERLAADCIVVNADVAWLYRHLLAGTAVGERMTHRIDQLPPSLSAALQLCVAADPDRSLPLVHHNVFFSSDYRREFAELAERPPTEPTIYLCNPDPRKESQRWFLLTNAPPLPAAADADRAAFRWTADSRRLCRDRALDQLDRHGLASRGRIQAESDVTPEDFAALFPGSRGALYGAAASSRMAAFRRPPNRVPGVTNLYCVGGGTHPGAGVPMVMLSAAIVADLIRRQG